MLILAMIAILCGALLVIRSGALSGRVLSPDDFLNEGGLAKTLHHIFTHNPFSGYHTDLRIMIYGVIGLSSMLIGIGIVIYFLFLFYLNFSR